MNRTRRSLLAARAREMRRTMPPAEKKLWYCFLAEYPIHFSRQILVGPYIVDFFCRQARLSIELDGSQHYEERNLEYDAVRKMYLEMEGIKELRFPNSSIRENFEGVCETIHQEVQLRRNDVCTVPLSLLINKH